DCGVMFPHETMFGVDLVIPDFAYLRGSRREAESAGQRRIDAVLITHGHQDHIGAPPWLMQALDDGRGPLPPVYATRFTRGLIAEKLAEHAVGGKVELREVAPSDPFSVGSFYVEYLKVCHSIVDACGI